MKQDNPFYKFMNTGTHKANIESLGAEIEYRKLTMLEDDEFNLKILSAQNGKDGEMDYNAASKIKYEKIAKMLIYPPVTVKDLQKLESDASAVFIEILAALEPSKRVDDEGNSKS